VGDGSTDAEHTKFSVAGECCAVFVDFIHSEGQIERADNVTAVGFMGNPNPYRGTKTTQQTSIGASHKNAF